MTTWERWRPEIAKAMNGDHHRIEDIDGHLAAGRLHPWMTDGCCLLLEFIRYPKEFACQVMWAAGDLDAMLAEAPNVEAWAAKAGCTEMLIDGRAGWARALRAMGYRPWSITVRKALR